MVTLLFGKSWIAFYSAYRKKASIFDTCNPGGECHLAEIAATPG
jgi:hypothetical protein